LHFAIHSPEIESRFIRKNSFLPYQTGLFVSLHFAICISRNIDWESRKEEYEAEK